MVRMGLRGQRGRVRPCFSMIAKTFTPEMGVKPFAIMKCLARALRHQSHLPLQAHPPRTYMIDWVMVDGFCGTATYGAISWPNIRVIFCASLGQKSALRSSIMQTG